MMMYEGDLLHAPLATANSTALSIIRAGSVGMRHAFVPLSQVYRNNLPVPSYYLLLLLLMYGLIIGYFVARLSINICI